MVLIKPIEKNTKKNGKELKILLLGTGETGKSTIGKQIQILYDTGFDKEYRTLIKPIIYKQIIKNMKVLIRESGKYGDGPIDTERADRINKIDERTPDTLAFEAHMTLQTFQDLENLWQSPAIKKTCAHSYKFSLNDSTEYFLERISILKQKDYTPNDQDILRTRVKSSAIVEKTFLYDGDKIRVLDVGGQRSERRKWAHCFPDINALIFVVAISEYDQCLREENTTRRLDESLRVYGEIINNKYFRDKLVILCFNKMDIFEKKIKERNLNLYYPDFKGTTQEEAITFIKEKFEALDKSKTNRVVEHTVTTNSDLFKTVFEAMIRHVLHETLRNAGFFKTRPNN